jgi:hypothetical protein
MQCEVSCFMKVGFARYVGHATLVALLPRSEKGTFGMRFICAPKARK